MTNLRPKEEEALESLSDLGSPSLFEERDGFSTPTVFHLENSGVTDEHMKDVGALEHLRELRLGNTETGDEGLKHLRKLTSLEVLGLANTRITDTGLRHLKGLKNLRVLRLGGTAVTDRGVLLLKHLTNLKVLGLRCTSVSESAVQELKERLPKMRIHVSEVPAYFTKETLGEAHDPAAWLNNCIEVARSTKGLPIAIDTWQLGTFEPSEVITLAVLASPLTIWRGSYTYEMNTFKPFPIEAWPGNFRMPLDVVVAANALLKRRLIVHLPKPVDVKVPDTMTREAQHNLEQFQSSLEEIKRVQAIKLRPAEELPRDGATVPLNLPVVFPSSPDALECFLDVRKDEITRLHRGLRGIFQNSQKVRNEKDFAEILEELGLEIRHLNDLYGSAEQDVYRGVKVKWVLGAISTAVALLIPELDWLKNVAVGRSMTALQDIVAMRPDKEIRKSDFYLAWKFQSGA